MQYVQTAYTKPSDDPHIRSSKVTLQHRLVHLPVLQVSGKEGNFKEDNSSYNGSDDENSPNCHQQDEYTEDSEQYDE